MKNFKSKKKRSFLLYVIDTIKLYFLEDPIQNANGDFYGIFQFYFPYIRYKRNVLSGYTDENKKGTNQTKSLFFKTILKLLGRR